jgi:chromosomal replication initiation ATPase DnaA
MKPALTPDRIAHAVVAAGRAFEVAPRAIISRRRLPSITRARMALYAALYRACETSYPQIGRLLNRDHTTVLYGVREAERDAAADPDYAARLARIVEACRA